MKICLPILLSSFSPNTADESDISEDGTGKRIVEIPGKYSAVDGETNPDLGDQADEEQSFAARSMSEVC